MASNLYLVPQALFASSPYGGAVNALAAPNGNSTAVAGVTSPQMCFFPGQAPAFVGFAAGSYYFTDYSTTTINGTVLWLGDWRPISLPAFPFSTPIRVAAGSTATTINTNVNPVTGTPPAVPFPTAGYLLVYHNTGVGSTPWFTTNYRVYKYTGVTASSFTGVTITSLGQITVGDPTTLSASDLIFPFVKPEDFSSNPGVVIGQGNALVTAISLYMWAAHEAAAGQPTPSAIIGSYANPNPGGLPVGANGSGIPGWPAIWQAIPSNRIPWGGTGSAPGFFGGASTTPTPVSFLLTAANIATFVAAILIQGTVWPGDEFRIGNTMLALTVTQRPASTIVYPVVGTTVGNTDPTIEWQYTHPEATSMSNFRVVVFRTADATGVGFNINDPSGVTAINPTVNGTWGTNSAIPVYDSGILPTADVSAAVIGTSQVTTYSYPVPVGILSPNVSYRAFVFTTDTGSGQLWPVMVNTGVINVINGGADFSCVAEPILMPGLSTPASPGSPSTAMVKATGQIGPIAVRPRANLLSAVDADAVSAGTTTWWADSSENDPRTGVSFAGPGAVVSYNAPSPAGSTVPYAVNQYSLGMAAGACSQLYWQTGNFTTLPCIPGEIITASAKLISNFAFITSTAYLTLRFQLSDGSVVMVVPAGTNYQVPVARESAQTWEPPTKLFIQAIVPPGAVSVNLGLVITSTTPGTGGYTVAASSRSTGGVGLVQFTANHAFVVGDTVTLAGLTHIAAFNGAQTVTAVPAANQIIFSNAGANVGFAAETGTATGAPQFARWVMIEPEITANCINLVDDAAFFSQVMGNPTTLDIVPYCGFLNLHNGTNAQGSVVKDTAVSYPLGISAADVSNTDLANSTSVFSFYDVGLFGIDTNPFLMACDARVVGIINSTAKLGSIGATGTLVAGSTLTVTPTWQRFTASLSPGGATVGHFGAQVPSGNGAASDQRYTNFQLERIWTLNDLTFERFNAATPINVPASTALGCYGSTTNPAAGQWWQLTDLVPVFSTVQVQTGTPHTGSNCLEINTAFFFGAIGAQQFFTVSGLTSVQFSWWWKYTTANASAYIEFFDSAGTLLSVSNTPGTVQSQGALVTVSGTQASYTQVVGATVPVPPDAAYARLVFRMTGVSNPNLFTGNVFVDDIVATLTGTLAPSTPWIDGGWSQGGLVETDAHAVAQGLGSSPELTLARAPTIAGPFTVVRSAPNTALPVPIVGAEEVDYEDYEHPVTMFGTAASLVYVASLASGIYTSPSNSFTVTDANGFAPSNWLLIDPLFPADNVILQVIASKGIDIKTEENQTVLMPAGRGRKVVLGDSLIFGDTITLQLQTLTNPDYAAIKKQYSKTYPLVLQSPDGEMWFVRATTRQRTRTWQGSYVRPYRTYSLVFEEVDPIT